MARVALLAIFLAAASADAGTLQVDLHDGRAATVRLATAVDDAHLANPPGYFPIEPAAAHVVERIVVEDIGRDPVRDPDIRVNGAPLLPVAEPLESLGVKDAGDLLGLFAAWRDRRIHGTTDLEANRNPLDVLQVFGATFCGDDARALGAITIAHGAEVRFARLNGHSAAEYRQGGDWVLLDGDQNAFYLRWDNRTPASSADLLADPLLALRTKIYGRHARWSAATAWQNAARFEFVETNSPQKTLHLKHPPSPRHWELLPGEKLVIDFTRAPEFVHGASESLRKDPTLRGADCVVELHVDPTSRHGAVALPFPARSVAAGEPAYEVKPNGEVILCQAAKLQFPPLRVGENEIAWSANGALRLTFETRDVPLQPVPSPPIRAPQIFEGSPRFELAAEHAERLWWQISADRDFHVVPPNLDEVGDFTREVRLSGPLDDTFLSPDREWFFRAKIRRNGVWSDWSAPVTFRVKKPAQPRIVAMEPADGDQMHIRWEPSPGEMLVFGSNRLDFLPEVYSDTEAVRMEDGVIRERRPNKNLLATIPGATGEAWIPLRAGYRLIARDGGTLSIPSTLARTKMPACVLQNRHEKAPGALTGRDLAVEMSLP